MIVPYLLPILAVIEGLVLVIVATAEKVESSCRGGRDVHELVT